MARGDRRGTRRLLWRVLGLEHRRGDHTWPCRCGCRVYVREPRRLVWDAGMPHVARGAWSFTGGTKNRNRCCAAFCSRRVGKRFGQGSALASRAASCGFGNSGLVRRRRMRRAGVAERWLERLLKPWPNYVGFRADHIARGAVLVYAPQTPNEDFFWAQEWG